jgi:uncharacterized protein
VASSVAGRPPKRGYRVRRFFRRWAIILGGGYLVICLVMWLIENRLVFFPTPASEAWNEPPVAEIEDVAFTSPAGTKIHGWWLPAESNAPVVLFFPGNAGNLSGRGQTIVRLRDRLGTSVLIIDYPGYGKSEGSPSEPACYDAAEAAVRWLRDVKQIPPERVIFYGESIGGGVGIEMATRYPCRALVLLKAFTSLPAAAKRHYPWLPVNWLMRNRFDNLSKLPGIHCPVFVLGADADRVVPFEHAETLFRIANEPKQLFRDEGSDHNDPLPDSLWPELRAFLDKLP